MLNLEASWKISEFCILLDSQVSVIATTAAEQESNADDSTSCLLTTLRALVNNTERCVNVRPLPLSLPYAAVSRTGAGAMTGSCKSGFSLL